VFIVFVRTLSCSQSVSHNLFVIFQSISISVRQNVSLLTHFAGEGIYGSIHKKFILLHYFYYFLPKWVSVKRLDFQILYIQRLTKVLLFFLFSYFVELISLKPIFMSNRNVNSGLNLIIFNLFSIKFCNFNTFCLFMFQNIPYSL
jgi:hypothetical protein